MIDAHTGGAWKTAIGQKTNQFVTVQLAQATQVVSQVVLTAFGGAPDPRNFQIRVSTTTSDDAAFTTVLAAQHAQNSAPQTFTFAPVSARFVELLIADNWGDPGTITVNGHHTQLAGLSDGEVRELDMVAWLHAGQDNVVEIRTEGAPGGSAWALLAEQPPPLSTQPTP